MLLGARTAAWGGGKKEYTASDYCLENLLAMWDYKEASGFNTPYDGSGTWKDLSGRGIDFTGLASNQIDSQGFVANRKVTAPGIGARIRTIEFVADFGESYYFSWNFMFPWGYNCGEKIVLFPYMKSATLFVWIHGLAGNGKVAVLPTTPPRRFTMKLDTNTNITEVFFDGVQGSLSNEAVRTWDTTSYIQNISVTDTKRFQNIRLYSSELTEQQRLKNAEVDKARFNLP